MAESSEKKEQKKKSIFGSFLNPYKNLLESSDKQPKEAETEGAEEPKEAEEVEEVEEQSKPAKEETGAGTLASKTRLGKILWKKK